MPVHMENYIKIRRKREQLGIPVAPLSVVLENHELLNKTLIDNRNGKEYVIEQVLNLWYYGWYTVLLVQNNGSHGIRIWRNISCDYPIILDQIEATQRNCFVKGEENGI